MSENEQATQKPDWAGIIRDMLILVGVMGALGYLCNLAMKPFEVVTPTDNLISLIRKGGVANGEDKPFTKELREGQEKLNALAKELREDQEKLKNTTFVNIPDGTGRTPLMWAVYTHNNDPEASLTEDTKRLWYVQALMAQPGIDLNMRDRDGFTALHWAAWSDMPECAFALIKGGMDVNAAENNGYTPLMLAALRGNMLTVQLLLEMGADPAAKNADGKTALDLATAKKNAYAKRGVRLLGNVLPDAVAKKMPRPYGLIYSAVREVTYNGCEQLLQNPPAPAPERTAEQVAQAKSGMINGLETLKAAQEAEEESAEEAATPAV